MVIKNTCFPLWGDVITHPTAAFPWLLQDASEKVIRATRVEYNGRVVPAVVMKCSNDVFRTPITDETQAKILMDVVTVLPFPIPFAYIIPIIFDDEEEPYWTNLCLHLFRINKVGHVPILNESGNVINTARPIVESFCQEPPLCGLIVLDLQYEILKAEMLSFVPFYEGRLPEIRKVLQFLDRNDVEKDFMDCKLPCDLFNTLFCFAVKSPSGNGIVIPTGRSLRSSDDTIFPVMEDHGRLLDRRAVHKRKDNTEYCVDLFVSHAHLDSEMAHSLVSWLHKLWPELKIEVTRADYQEAFQSDPTYFFKELKQSKCVLYLVTPNSLNRPMVDTEIGISAEKAIVSVLCGGATLNQLSDKVSKNLFINLDIDKAVEVWSDNDWEQLIKLLADVLALPLPKYPYEAPKSVNIVAADVKRSSLTEQYIDDCYSITKATHRQTVDEADEKLMKVILDSFENEGGDPKRIKSLVQAFPPQQKLLIYLQKGNNVTLWLNMLEFFPALLNESLLPHIDMLISKANQLDDSPRVEKLDRIRDVVINLLFMEADSKLQVAAPAKPELGKNHS